MILLFAALNMCNKQSLWAVKLFSIQTFFLTTFCNWWTIIGKFTIHIHVHNKISTINACRTHCLELFTPITWSK